MTLLDGFVLGALALWFGATVLNQLPFWWAKTVSSRDVLHLLPRWTFFAPRPGSNDYVIVYREVREDGSAGEFVELIVPKRGPWSVVLNPRKRVRKTLHDLANGLGRLLASDDWDRRSIAVSLPYVALLNFLSSTPAAGRRVQFCVIATKGHHEPEANAQVILTSALHRV